MYEGHADATQKLLELSTTSVALTSSAKEVRALRRTYRLYTPEGCPQAVPRLRYGSSTMRTLGHLGETNGIDDLTAVFHMEAVGQPMQQHLEGELEKVLPSTSEIPGPVKPDLEKGELSGC